VSGRFSDAQRKIYQLVLDAQLASIEAVKPGATLEQVHQRSVDVVTEGLVRLGLLQGEPAQLVKDEKYKKYFMHGTSHWLGMDVHDVGRYYVDGVARPLEPGCVLTVEPGVYVPPNDESAPPEFRGIGVRIEDDVVCTESGCEVLTREIPKHVSELEALLQARREDRNASPPPTEADAGAARTVHR
jgi:Xaa-Pro aminopeptidase